MVDRLVESQSRVLIMLYAMYRAVVQPPQEKTEMFGLIGLQRNLGPCSMCKLALQRGLL